MSLKKDKFETKIFIAYKQFVKYYPTKKEKRGRGKLA